MNPSGKKDGEAGTSIITDHAYMPRPGQPWGLCVACGLSEAAHVEAFDPYRPCPQQASNLPS